MPNVLSPADPPVKASHELARPPLFFLLSLGLLHFWRWSYVYGSSDHDELIPQVLHRVDPSLFTRDWFVISQSGSVTVRTTFVELLRLFGAVIPLPTAVMLLHIVVLVAVCWTVWQLAYAFVPDTLGASFGTFLAVVLFPYWTLGANGLTSGILVPEYIAWALALPAVWLFVKKKRLAAALLLGLAGWMQILVGIQTTAVLGLVALWEAAQDRSNRAVGDAVVFGLVAAVVAAPIALPILLAPPMEGPTVEGVSTFHALARLRVPHHYLLFSFGAGAYLRFGLLVVAGIAALWTQHRAGRGREATFVVRFLIVTGGILCAATIFTEAVPVLFVAKLQLFKLTVWVSTMMSLFVGAWAAWAMPSTLREFGEWVLKRRTAGLIATGVAAAATIVAVAIGFGPAASRYRPVAYTTSDLSQVEGWALTNTPEDALFLIPPSNTTFRVHARRSVAVNFKPTPYQRGGIDVWLNRTLAVAPMPVPENGRGFKEALDDAYAANDETDWHRLSQRFGAEWALVDAARTSSPPSARPAFRAGDWAVYRLH